MVNIFENFLELCELRIPDEVIDNVKEDVAQRGGGRGCGKGRGRGGPRAGGGGDRGRSTVRPWGGQLLSSGSAL